VEDICEAAGLTKGGFFPPFHEQGSAGAAAVEHWMRRQRAVFDGGVPVESGSRWTGLVAYVDFRNPLLEGGRWEFTCLVGTMVRGIYETHPPLRAACDESISSHAAHARAGHAEAMRLYGVTGDWTPRVWRSYNAGGDSGIVSFWRRRGGRRGGCGVSITCGG